MILSTNISTLPRGDGWDVKAIKMLAEAGFDAIDYSLGPTADPFGPWMNSNYKEYAKLLLRVAEDNGVYFNQAHAPLPINKYGQVTEESVKSIGLDNMGRVFEVCALLKIPHVVIHGLAHPAISATPQIKLQANIEYFEKLRKMGEPFGVRVALENLMRTFSSPDSLYEIITALDSDYFLACVDVGHSNMVNNGAADVIRKLGHWVQALHIHDNHVDFDEHLIPGLGTINWDTIIDALVEVDYPGDFTLELANHSTSCFSDRFGFDEDFFPKALKFSAKAGRNLADRLEARLREKHK